MKKLGFLAILFLSVVRTADAAQTAATDLAQIAVAPIDCGTAPPAWQTIYDYSGGAVPPGARIVAEGKWIDPTVHSDKAGITFGFPDLPDQPQAAQELKLAFIFERPIANYPTRLTVSYTSFFDQTVPKGGWFPFLMTVNDNTQRLLFGRVSVDPSNLLSGRLKKNPALATLPFHAVGNNTMVFSFDSAGNNSVSMNGKDATGFFFDAKHSPSKNLRPGSLLLPGIALRNEVSQFPPNKGNWFAIHAFKLEQMRPPLDASAVAEIDLTVRGSDPARVSIEVADAQNDCKGYVLRDALVDPGMYRLYWDGVDQKTNGKPDEPDDAAWVNAGAYTFRLTTSKVAVHYAGMINNSTPKFNKADYGLFGATALAMTPPNTPPSTKHARKMKAVNNKNDTRKIDATDSVQTLGMSYDAFHGLWIGADGTLITNGAGNNLMQVGRGLAMTPPDRADPADPEKQFYFVSKSIQGGNAIVSCSFPIEGHPAPPKVLSSPDWNRTKPGFVPYDIQIGQLPHMLGQQHYLFFPMNVWGGKAGGNWIFRNIRLYEDGSPDPGPLTFAFSKFSPRVTSQTKKPSVIVSGTVWVEDGGHAVHLKGANTVNYPLDYNITENTILAFDLNVINESNSGRGNGIGLSPLAACEDPKEDGARYFHFQEGRASHDPRVGFQDPSIGAYSYPEYQPNTLYTDAIMRPPAGLPRDATTGLLWQPGFYGVKISEDGKLLFACNNADNRLEVRDLSRDGRAVAKIPIEYPMFVSMAPEGAAAAGKLARYLYVTSPKAGLLRIAWNPANNTFGTPETLTPAAEFAYPRGVVFDAAAGRIFVCDTFNLDRSKTANQIVVIAPETGKVLARFGKLGGVDPAMGGRIDDGVFTCPLTIDVDSKGALWVNDFFSSEVRKYQFDPASNGFTLERRVIGPDQTCHYYWLPGGPPTQVWYLSHFFVRTEADIDAEGRFTNQRTTSASRQLTNSPGRCYAHFSKVGDCVYATFAGQATVWQQAGDGWTPRFAFGGNPGIRNGETAGKVTLLAGLRAAPGKRPTALDEAIKAAADADWDTRPWAWSDLNGNGKMDYSADDPEFKIFFNSPFSLDVMPSSCFRSTDGAYVRPVNSRKKGANPGEGEQGILVLPPSDLNGHISYDWSKAQVIPCTKGTVISDILAQDGRFYALRSTRSFGEGNISSVQCYNETGKLLWTREHENNDLLSIQPLGDGLISIMDRAWSMDGPVFIRTKDGDFVTEVDCRDNMDNWGHTALRADADTGYIGLVQAFKITGLSTIKSASATINLPGAGRQAVKAQMPARNQANTKERIPAPNPANIKGSADDIIQDLLGK